MTRILLIISLAAASLAAKDRAWQTGQLLDNGLNPYFRTISANGVGAKSAAGPRLVGDVSVQVNVHTSTADVIFDDLVIEGEDTVYMVETTRFKNTKAPHLSLSRPLSFAVEKNKVWIKDLDKDEFEAQILKQVPKGGSHQDTVAAAVEPTPVTEKPAAKQPAAPAPKTTSKPELFATAPAQQKPIPAAPKPAAKPAPPAPKPDPKAEASVSKPEATPAPPAAKVAVVDPKRVQKPEPVAKPETGTTVRASTKDRAWQSGSLLSIVNNSYFFNVTFSSDSDGSGWPFVQGSDGRYTVNGQIGNPTSSLYTYDNYVIESQFCVYLVQRMRPKTSAPVRLPGTQTLKFAVEKNKLWVLDEENKEYETKVVRLVQKAAIVDPLTRAAAR